MSASDSATSGAAGGTDTPQWRAFERDLQAKGIRFAAVQFADEHARAEVLASCESLSALDRAVVSSTWATIAKHGPDGGKASPQPHPSSSALSSSPPPGAAANPPEPQQQQQQLQAASSATPFGQDAAATGQPATFYQQPASQAAIAGAGNVSGSFGGYGPQASSVMMAAPGTSYGLGAAAGSLASSPSLLLQQQQQQQSAATLGAPIRATGQPGGGGAGGVVASDPTSLRAALARGDSTAALPLASELLQHDAAALCVTLQEYLPHMTVEQIRGILGLGAPASGGAPGVGGGLQGGGGAQGAGPLLNGKPISAGTVLTAQGLSAHFGAGFTATSNGNYLTFPYTVQPRDQITVRGLTDRFL